MIPNAIPLLNAPRGDYDFEECLGIERRVRVSYDLVRSTRRTMKVEREGGRVLGAGQLLKILNTDSHIHRPFSPIDLLSSNLLLEEYR